MILLIGCTAIFSLGLIGLAFEFAINGKVPHVEIKLLRPDGDDFNCCCAPVCADISGRDTRPPRGADIQG